jgi:hypothetical protein
MYVKGVQHFTDGRVDWDTDVIKVLLLTGSYTPDQDLHDFRDDLGANEVAASGSYVAGGATVGTRSIVTDGPTNEVRLIGADVQWTGFTGAYRYAVIYKSRGGAASADELIAYSDLGAQSVTNATVTLDYDQTNGMCKFTVGVLA